MADAEGDRAGGVQTGIIIYLDILKEIENAVKKVEQEAV